MTVSKDAYILLTSLMMQLSSLDKNFALNQVFNAYIKYQSHKTELKTVLVTNKIPNSLPLPPTIIDYVYGNSLENSNIYHISPKQPTHVQTFRNYEDHFLPSPLPYLFRMLQ